MRRNNNRRAPARVDAYGVKHAPGCTTSTWAVSQSAASCQIARCLGCGAVRIIVEEEVTQ